MAPRDLVPAVSALRSRYEQRGERLTALRHVRSALVSLAGLIGRPVLDQADGEIGRVVDVVARRAPFDRRSLATSRFTLSRTSAVDHCDRRPR